MCPFLDKHIYKSASFNLIGVLQSSIITHKFERRKIKKIQIFPLIVSEIESVIYSSSLTESCVVLW